MSEQHNLASINSALKVRTHGSNNIALIADGIRVMRDPDLSS